ncbi:hypothetical protein PPTG_24921 [Phytophthora nicotianae INRA-310]|uniref:Uncharacterized protein n=1 Tax=Phytophthora nicotianae (strain INRA-310) TaxID=761204 RepID=W2P9N1_PHYN3|nr:hypothetical protein PPTG_24921 [Phytophthora nicotianae INRA-310]ETM97531.1 hypothetical protein PPTG_24921 [Phytophthora nicotianae INRA-310]
MTSNLKFVLEMLDKYPVQLEDPYLRSRNIECQQRSQLQSRNSADQMISKKV